MHVRQKKKYGCTPSKSSSAKIKLAMLVRIFRCLRSRNLERSRSLSLVRSLTHAHQEKSASFSRGGHHAVAAQSASRKWEEYRAHALAYTRDYRYTHTCARQRSNAHTISASCRLWLDIQRSASAQQERIGQHGGRDGRTNVRSLPRRRKRLISFSELRCRLRSSCSLLPVVFSRGSPLARERATG